MKNYKLLLFVFMAMPFAIMSQSFETDRLPLGDPDRKYDFCAVKLDKQFDTNLNKEIKNYIQSDSEPSEIVIRNLLGICY